MIIGRRATLTTVESALAGAIAILALGPVLFGPTRNLQRHWTASIQLGHYIVLGLIVYLAFATRSWADGDNAIYP